jgi:carbohydrate-binding DOMON domain-containing protein
VATSTPPRQAAVQIPLIELLLERGAAIDDEREGSNIVMDALNNGCPEAARALADRGARIPHVIAAAGVGRPDLVERLAGGASGRDDPRQAP